MEHLSKSSEPQPDRSKIEFLSESAGIARAEHDATYVDHVDPRWVHELPFAPSRVCIDADAVEIRRAGATSQRIERGTIGGAWFVPAFVERALGLALGGAHAEERPIVVTADFVGWLVFAIDRDRWLCVATNERAEALAAIASLGLGAVSRPYTWTLFEPGARAASSARWLRSQTHVRRAMGATVVSSVALDAALGYLGSIAGVSAVTVTGAALVVTVSLARAGVARSLSRFRVEPAERLAIIERSSAKPLRFDLRKIEHARLTRTGFVLDYEDAPRPVVLEVLSPVEGARATEGSRSELARLRVAHTFIDHALAARDAITRRA
jgi:hypothetical protein